jgi:dTDP-4-dehydrorhamnose reductase
MRVLILGATGYLGSQLCKLYTRDSIVLGTYNENSGDNLETLRWQANDSKGLENIIKAFNPNLIINCVGLANVDVAEILPEKALMLNSVMAQEVGRICERLKVKLVHISTDHFKGLSDVALNEDDSISCPNVYSYSKFLGEKYLLHSNPASIIIRTNFFHFTKNSSKNFIDSCLNLTPGTSQVNGFSDVIFSPVSTTYLKESISNLLDINYSGVIHVAPTESISKYEFLKELFQFTGQSNIIVKSQSIDDAQLTAPRPKFMALSNKKYQMLTNDMVPSIKNMIKMELISASILKE